MWDLPTGKIQKISDFEMDRDGSDLAANRRLFIHHGIVVDVASGKEIARLPKAGAEQFSRQPFVFSGDGSQVIRISDRLVTEKGTTSLVGQALHIDETLTGKPISDIPAGWVYRAGFHPNPRLVFTVDRKEIVFWDLATKKPVHRQPIPETIAASEVDGTRISCVATAPDGSRMATGHWDGTVLLWDLPIVLSRLEAVDAKTVESMWATLEGADAGRAWELIWRLAESPDQALPALRERLKPIAALSVEQVRPLIADLDHEEFARREQAMKRLRELGPQAEAALQAASKGNLSAEQRQRIEEILAAIADPKSALTPTAVAELRALRILERIQTPEARRLLKELAGGAESAPLTREARDALERIGPAN
jgi:hypothetical protein